MAAIVLDRWSEPAERTTEHERLRAMAPPGVTLHDRWDCYAVAVEGPTGEAEGVQTIRLAAVSTTPPDRLGGRR